MPLDLNLLLRWGKFAPYGVALYAINEIVEAVQAGTLTPATGAWIMAAVAWGAFLYGAFLAVLAIMQAHREELRAIIANEQEAGRIVTVALTELRTQGEIVLDRVDVMDQMRDLIAVLEAWQQHRPGSQRGGRGGTAGGPGDEQKKRGV